MKVKIYISLFLITLTCLIPAQAQVGEQRHNFSLGINGGVNLNNVSFSPSVQQNFLMGITGGITARYISEKYFKMICGAQIEVNFSQHGWSEAYKDYPQVGYTRTMNYVEIPFLAHLAFGKERGFQFYYQAGPQIRLRLSDSHTIKGDWETLANSTNIVTEQHNKPVDNTFDYGIAGGAGVEVRTKAGNFIVEGRYYYALSDFYGSTKKDFFARSAHGTITAKITYLFDITK